MSDAPSPPKAAAAPAGGAAGDPARIDPSRVDPPAAPAHGALPKGGNLLGDINVIAEEWFGQNRFTGGPGIPTPEALMAAAQERGLHVSYEQRSITSVADAEFPCVVLEKDGSSRLVTGRRGPVLDCVTNGSSYELDCAELAARQSGTVFFIRPRLASLDEPALAGAPPGTEPEVTAVEERAHGLLWHVIRETVFRRKRLFFQLALASALSNALMIALPIYSMAIYDRVVPHLAYETLWALTAGLMISLLFDLAIRSARLRVLDALALQTQLELQSRFFRRFLGLKMTDAPTLAGPLTSGLRELEGLCQSAPSVVCAVLIDLPFVAIVLLMIYSVGGMAALAPMFCAAVIVVAHIGAHIASSRASKATNGLARAQSNAIHEAVETLEAVKVATAEDLLLRRWERLSDDAAVGGHLGRWWNGVSAQISISMSSFVTVLTLFFGVYEIGQGWMTVGALSACSLLAARIIGPISQLVTMLHRTQQYAKALDSIESVLLARGEALGDPTRRIDKPVRGAFDFKEVSFRYHADDPLVLDGVNISIRAGEKVAIVGRVGSGKTTVLRLMTRLQAPTQGAVQLDGSDIRQMPPRLLRRAVSLMRQDVVLFDDTLQANIVFGLDDIAEEPLQRAAQISGIRDVAARHASGYGMRVGPRGERLSGGERQMVALTRALVTNPRVLLLDEPTAAMDSVLEARVVRELQSFLGERTLVVATHRAPVLSLVDRIIWMEHGRIVADGPKAEVMRKLSGQAA